MTVNPRRFLPPPAAPELVGIVEVAERLNVQRATVDKWRSRGVLPDADFELAAGPVWWWQTIAQWARTTGRL